MLSIRLINSSLKRFFFYYFNFLFFFTRRQSGEEQETQSYWGNHASKKQLSYHFRESYRVFICRLSSYT